MYVRHGTGTRDSGRRGSAYEADIADAIDEVTDETDDQTARIVDVDRAVDNLIEDVETRTATAD